MSRRAQIVLCIGMALYVGTLAAAIVANYPAGASLGVRLFFGLCPPKCVVLVW